MTETRTFDLDGWGVNRVAPVPTKNPYARFSRGDEVRAINGICDIVLQCGEHVRVEVDKGELGTVVFPGPDAFGLVRVEFQGMTLDAWESDLTEAD